MGVKILRWPAESEVRERLRSLGVPRLLILEGNCRPPSADLLEDWVRSPVSSDELLRRVATLQELSRAGVPVLETSGILHFGGHWISLSPANAAIMRVLLRNYQCLVPRSDLIQEVWPGIRPTRNTVDLRLLRLRRQLADVGLRIQTVPSQGYLLDAVEQRDTA